MTWQEAKAVAAPLVEQLLGPRPDGSAPAPGDLIALSDFADEATHAFLKAEDRWTLSFHRMVTKAVARTLRRRGVTVAIVRIGLAEYYDWLPRQQRADDAHARADFIAWKMQNHDPAD